MNALVGYTGFVGSNLVETGQFQAVYNSKNITEAYGTKPDLLVYAGIRAEKYLANSHPSKDMEQILQAEENIKKIQPGKLVLISTIDVFKEPKFVDENSEIDTCGRGYQTKRKRGLTAVGAMTVNDGRRLLLPDAEDRGYGRKAFKTGSA